MQDKISSTGVHLQWWQLVEASKHVYFVQTFILYNDHNNNNNNNNNNNSNSDDNDNDNSIFFIKYPSLITTLTIKIYLPLIFFFF